LSVDLTIFQTLQDYARWKKQGVLMSFKPEGWEQIHPSFKDADGDFVGVAVYGLSYAYNTKELPENRLPKSAADFLKPEFKGKVITTYPNDDDVTLYLFYTVVQKYGWDFMDKYMANDPQWIRGHLGVARGVASGKAEVSFDTMANVTLNFQKAGQPTDIAISNVDPLPIWPQTTAIFKDAPHPNAAKLYITWFLAKEQQSRIGTWPARLDVQPPAGLKPIFDYTLANDFRSFMTH
jgi:ABC-type Fe3+ transport system substrate-binding protein